MSPSPDKGHCRAPPGVVPKPNVVVYFYAYDANFALGNVNGRASEGAIRELLSTYVHSQTAACYQADCRGSIDGVAGDESGIARDRVFGHEFNLDQRPARGQIALSLPSPSERDAAMRCDFRIGSASKLASGNLDPKNSPGVGIKCVLLAEPARHEGGLDEEPENRFGRCGDENLALNIEHLTHHRLGFRSVRSAARFNRDNPPSQNDPTSQ
jgi:hypothetical protein